ncbi:cation channel family protein (macronuclear) [Tetrahymena thermophila SB210]|uniref:Cation channel family protein n=1 Tax=Tetrahymena thermophila (strain SB210) TaxID=312017 RepID=W7X2T7_TETTS|nr:cation channel family protein [Tetrahymena thermophila SB210]EWS73610.1 cation channel family protein [Tetrahymena thermophila SB210]|eukprot:XP_012653840.1 cation channel family protein [Tetrahymena thermophila SB210]
MNDSNNSFIQRSCFNEEKDDPFVKIVFVKGIDQLQGENSSTLRSITLNSSHNSSQSCQNNLDKISASVNSSRFIQTTQNEQNAEQTQLTKIYVNKEAKLDEDQQIELSQCDKQSLEEADDTEQEQQQKRQSQALSQVSKHRRKHNIQLLGEESKKNWKKNWLNILYYVSKMKSIAKLTKRLFRHELLTAKQLKLIGDQTVNIEKLKKMEKYNFQKMMSFSNFNKILKYKTYKKIKINVKLYFSNIPSLLLSISNVYNKFISYILSLIPIFNYLSNFYIFWQAIIFVCSFINFIYLPFEFSFQNQRTIYLQYYISIICPIIFSLDIFIKANTQTFQQGNQLRIHKQILKEYLTGTFFSDLVSIISLNQSLFELRGFYFLFFLRFSRSLLILDIFREKFFSKTYISGIISLILLFASSLFFAHLFACFWYYVGTLSTQGWINFYQLDKADIYSNYIYSYYFIIVTMTTIGYGDITAKTTEERLVMIFFTLISCGIFGYIINSIGNILGDIKQKSDKYLTELAKLNQYFKKYQVSLQLQANVRRYLQFTYKEGIQDKLSALESLNNLSQHLQNQIKMDVVSRELKQIGFLKQICKEETFCQLSLQVQEKIYQPEQVILDQNEIKEPAIYIINYGRVLKNSQYDLSSKVNDIYELKEKQSFGVIEFFMNLEASKFNYKSKELTSIYSLNLSAFLKVIKQDSEIYEKFCFLRDQIVYQKSLHLVKHFCESCRSLNHNLKECPCIFYKSRKLTIIKRYQQNIKETLRLTTRKKKLKENSLMLNKQFVSQIILFQQDNINQLSLYDNSLSSIEDQHLFSSQKLHFSNTINSNQKNNREDIEFKTSQLVDQLQLDQQEHEKIIIDIKSPLIVQRKKQEHEKLIGDEQINTRSFQKLEAIEEQNEKQKLNQQPSILRNNYLSITSIQDNQCKNDQISVLQGIQTSIKDIFRFLIGENETIKWYKKHQVYQNMNSSAFKKMEAQLVSNKNIKSNFQIQDTNQNNRSSYVDQLMTHQNKQDIQNFCQDLDRMQKYKTYYPKFNYDIVIEKSNSRSYIQNIPLILRLIKLKRKTVNLKKRSKVIKQQ